MPEKTTRFTGVPSGNSERFSFDVTPEDWERLGKDWQKIVPEFDEDTLYEIEVTVRMTPVGKAKKIEE